MVNYKKHILFTIILLSGILAIYGSIKYINKHNSDPTNEMKTYFVNHNAEFTKLVILAEANPLILRVDMVSFTPSNVPSKTVKDIRASLSALNLSIFERVSSSIRLFGDKSISSSDGRYSYGYVYTPNPPQTTFSRLVEIKPKDGIGHVPISGNWYLIGFYEE